MSRAQMELLRAAAESAICGTELPARQNAAVDVALRRIDGELRDGRRPDTGLAAAASVTLWARSAARGTYHGLGTDMIRALHLSAIVWRDPDRARSRPQLSGVVRQLNDQADLLVGPGSRDHAAALFSLALPHRQALGRALDRTELAGRQAELVESESDGGVPAEERAALAAVRAVVATALAAHTDTEDAWTAGSLAHEAALALAPPGSPLAQAGIAGLLDHELAHARARGDFRAFAATTGSIWRRVPPAASISHPYLHVAYARAWIASTACRECGRLNPSRLHHADPLLDDDLLGYWPRVGDAARARLCPPDHAPDRVATRTAFQEAAAAASRACRRIARLGEGPGVVWRLLDAGEAMLRCAEGTGQQEIDPAVAADLVAGTACENSVQLLHSVDLLCRFRAYSPGRSRPDAPLPDGILADWKAAAGFGASPELCLAIAVRRADHSAERPRADELGRAAAYEQAVTELLPEAAALGRAYDDNRTTLGARPWLVPTAAAAALDAGEGHLALTMLETGRNVIWNQFVDAHTDAGADDEELRVVAEQMNLLGRHAAEGIFDGADRPRRRLAWAVRGKLRQDRSRDPDERAVARLTDAGLVADLLPDDGAAVVVNAAARRCDALIVTRRGGVDVLNLDDHMEWLDAQKWRKQMTAILAMTRTDAPLAAAKLRDVLSDVWHRLAEPVIERLGWTGHIAPGFGPRLWWCPTGPLTAVPLHAAMRYADGEEPDGVLHRAVPSYAMSLSALRRELARPDVPLTGKDMVAVAMPTTPGHDDLPGALAEAELVRARLGGDCDLITGRDARPEHVHARLAARAAAHLSCHAAPPTAAELGHLVLHGGAPLGVADIARIPADGPAHGGKFAFLSACGTARGDQAVPDESLHLAAAMHVAGYRHVVGTLWNVSASAAQAVAERFYSRAISDGRLDPGLSAYALHAALRAFVDEGVDLGRGPHSRFVPTAWAPFAHIGP